MKRSLWIIPFILAIVGIMAISASAGQVSAATDSLSLNALEDDNPPPSMPSPEFPTLALPAGLLVGMIYIIFLLKNKGRKDPSFHEKEDTSHSQDTFTH
ncbi:MAG TPA: hypothetical protein ENO00_06400 [Deltaproteobacteria bacterium]|nr:hypothetical protein [Deltaproteobacteria bacterium]